MQESIRILSFLRMQESIRILSFLRMQESNRGVYIMYYVYIMTNKYNTVLYIGVTNDIIRRVYEHKNGMIEGFTNKYRCHKLVWYQETNDIESAIVQEKRMKKWKREYKENVINEFNPKWKDLYYDLADSPYVTPANASSHVTPANAGVSRRGDSCIRRNDRKGDRNGKNGGRNGIYLKF